MSVLAPLAAGAAAPAPLDPGTRFYVPAPDAGAVEQGIDLLKSGKVKDALRIAAMVAQGHAVWFTGGTPAEVEKAVRKTMRAAALQRRMPVLVAYDLPYRDCGQYSAGGASATDEYLAWIDGFAKGIGDGKAIVILEPDGLGIIPYYTPIYGSMEWCQPKDGNGDPAPGATAADRFAQLNGAVDRLALQPGARTYLDGTHATWLGVGEAADRLIKAGVDRAAGFFVNVSNYKTTADSVHFGNWISRCIGQATANAWYNPGWCPSQYNPALGYRLDYSDAYAASVDAQFDAMGAVGTARFVIDTSRNGRGAWTPAASYPDAQDWCNPPGRGLGARPTADTGALSPLLDALLWVKVPGESDGQCNRGVAGSTTDPEWGGIVDPAAGDWFPQQALELARLASPPLF